MKRTPEMEQLFREELQCEVLEGIESELKAQGRWIEADKEIDRIMEKELYEEHIKAEMDEADMSRGD